MVLCSFALKAEVRGLWLKRKEASQEKKYCKQEGKDRGAHLFVRFAMFSLFTEQPETTEAPLLAKRQSMTRSSTTQVAAATKADQELYDSALKAWLMENPEGSEIDFRDQLKKEGSTGYLDFLFFWGGGATDGSVSNVSMDNAGDVAPDFWDHHRPYLIKGAETGDVEYNEVQRVRKVRGLARLDTPLPSSRPGTLTATPCPGCALGAGGVGTA